MKKLLAALLVFSASAHATDDVHRFYGYAFDLKTGAYLYTEVHTEKIRNGKWIGGTTAYYAADGTRIGAKTLDFSKDRYVPLYTLEMPQDGYLEGITDAGDPIHMRKRAEDGAEIKTGKVEREGDMLADAGFHNYLVDHFDRLQAGEVLHFTFVVPGYLDTFRFKARKAGEDVLDGRRVVKLEVSPDSALSLIAPDLSMYYDPKTLNLLDYRGTSDIHDPETGDAYEAHIVYPRKPPTGAPKKLPPLK